MKPLKILYNITLFLIILIITGCGEEKDTVKNPQYMEEHCREIIGEPRIVNITKNIWSAVGYDLANTVLIHTKEGNIIVDPAMSPKRAGTIKKALLEKAPKGKIRAIIFTHSHIDHIGGASVWVEEGTEIWATEAFTNHFLKQYGVYMHIETLRGRRQFGKDVPLNLLPCSALGRRVDIDAAKEIGIRLPNRTFTGKKSLKFGELTLELNEAHGETHDQLFIWIPEEKTIIGGDNFYWAFPNLYTIRGSSPRPIDDWIESIDAMRRKSPEKLVPNHTNAITGKKKIAEILTNYRDAIQWIRDETIRGANLGEDLDTLSENIKLPKHLSKLNYLRELYGQVDWSVKAIYTNALGWFDGRAEELYPMKKSEASRREIELMGGQDKVQDIAKEAIEKGDPRWGVHLLTKLRKSGLVSSDDDDINEMLASGFEKIAGGIYNTNGRGYLLQTARELREGVEKLKKPKMIEELAQAIPLEKIFFIMSTRLITDKAMDAYETVHFVFPDENKRFIVTVRHGVAETVTGAPLPGTPEPVAELTVDSKTYKRMAMKMISPVSAFTSGKIKIKGSWIKFLAFMNRFERGL